MFEAELVQGSPEWYAARCGSVGSSEIADATRKRQDGKPAATRAALMARKVCERLTGTPVATFTSRAMWEGKERQGEALAAYGFLIAPVAPIGLVRHPYVIGAHASPDGTIGNHGLVEVKCPEHAAHLETLLTEKIEPDYLKQMQWQLASTGRHFCDFVSYHPDFPPALQLYVRRVERDPEWMLALELEVLAFIAELERKVAELRERYELLEAA